MRTELLRCGSDSDCAIVEGCWQRIERPVSKGGVEERCDVVADRGYGSGRSGRTWCHCHSRKRLSKPDGVGRCQMPGASKIHGQANAAEIVPQSALVLVPL